MDFNEALKKVLNKDKESRENPFLLFSKVSDLIGNDYDAKRAAEEFYRVDAKYNIAKNIIAAKPLKYKRRKKLYYRRKPMELPPKDAYVYFSYDTPVLHIARECPELNNFCKIKRVSFDRASAADFKQKYFPKSTNGKKAKKAKKAKKGDKPCICPRCGGFTPRKKPKFLFWITRWLFYNFGIDIH